MLIIGIAGGTGSGKTTLTDTLADEFAPYITVIRHDDYYKSHDDMNYEERCRLNYDEPQAFDNELLISHLEKLRAGEAVDGPKYDYKIHNRSRETQKILPNYVIIVEGILIFAQQELSDMFDEKIFVDTDADIRLIRRILRDTRERGRSLESVVTQYINTVKPMHEKYVEPTRKRADIVVPEGGENKVALSMISSRIERYLRESVKTGENQ